MKKALFIILISLSIHNVFSQCIIDAGANQHICFPELLTPNVGALSATITAGTAPYQIEWTTTYQVGNNTFNASDFLDDIHSLTPNLTSYVGDSLVFYISVTDDNGDVCTDSVVVSFSLNMQTLDECKKIITIGDSIELFVPGIAGIADMQYTWSPNYNISDVNVENPLVWPDTNMHYTVIGIDQHGCQFTSSGCFVMVHGLGLEETEQGAFYIFPNPASDVLQLKIANADNVSYAIIDAAGKTVMSSTLNGNSTIDISQLSSGVYALQLKMKEQFIGTTKFIKL